MADPNIRAQILEVLSDPMNLPVPFWEYSTQRWLTDAPVFPVSQVFGFSSFTPQTATPINTQEATTSTTYTDLATAGPTLSGLEDGHYLVLYSVAAVSSVAGTSANASPGINGATPSDNDLIFTHSTSFTTISGWVVASLSNANSSTIKLQYKSGGVNTSTFSFRRLTAIRYANL